MTGTRVTGAGATESRATGARLAAVALIVPEYDPAIRFFVDVLGFSLVEDIPMGAKRWVTVEPPAGGARLVLARAEGDGQRAAIGAQGGGRVWLFLTTDDIARDRARMQAADVVFEEPVRHEPYGKVCVWRDPFGNRWDLIEPAG